MVDLSCDTETRYGLMTVLSSPGDIVSNFILRYGEWSEFEIEFVASNLQKEARVADIGAFVGSFGIALSQRVSLGHICFVEANPAILKYLHNNVERNCSTTHSFVDALVYPEGQTAEVIRRSGENQGSISYNVHGDAEIALDAALPDRTVTLREFLNDSGPFELLKMDIEGLEYDVVQGIAKELASGDLSIWAECNEAYGSLDLAEFLLSCGLRVHYFAYPSFNPENFRGEQEALFPMAYEAGLYASRVSPRLSEKLVQAGCLLHEITDRASLKQALWRTPRWCPPTILADRPEESLAIAIHYLTGDTFATFLAEPGLDDQKQQSSELRAATPLALAETLEQVQNELRTRVSERDQLRQELSEVRALLNGESRALATMQSQVAELTATLAVRRDSYTASTQQLTAQIGLEREQRQHQTRLAEWAEALAGDRLELLRAERKQHLEWHEKALSAERHTSGLERQFQELLSRRSLRAVNTMVRPLVRFPRMYTAARVIWGGSRRIAGYLRLKR